MIESTKEKARQVHGIAEEEEFERIAQRINEQVLEFLDDQELTVAFLGEFSVGKSSILNCLFGQEILPTKVKPTTSLVTQIRQGQRKYLLHRDGDVRQLDQTEFQALASGQTPSEEGDRLELYVDSQMLGERGCFVDTPGVQSMNDQHEDITYGYLPEADAACIVLDANQGEVPRSVVEFLRDRILARDIAKLVFVLNRTDEIPGSERNRVLEKVRGTLTQFIDSPQIVMTSAELNSTDPDGPGVGKLKEVLTEEVLAKRRQIIGERANSRLDSGLASLIEAISTKRDNLERSNQEIDDTIEDLKKAREEVQQRLRRLEDRIRDDMGSIRSLGAKRVRALLRDVSGKARQAIMNAEPKQLETLNLQSKISGWIARGFEELVNTDLEPRLNELAGDIESEVQSISAAVRDLDVGVSRENKTIDSALNITIEGVLLVILNIILPGQWLVALMGRVLGTKLFDKLKGPIANSLKEIFGRVSGSALLEKTAQKVEMEVMGLESELTSQLTDQLNDVEANLTDELNRQFNDQLDEHQQALEAARQERRKKDEEVAEIARQLDEKLRTLREIRTSLEGGQAAAQ